MAVRKRTVRKKAEGAYHHGDLKASLKKAALSLVSEKGARSFSLNEASRMAGVTVSAPYRHFADKDALLAEIACDGCELLTRELAEAAALVEGVKNQMVEAGMAYLRFSATHSDYFAVIFSAGLDKTKYPDLERSAGEAYGVILNLAKMSERTPQLAIRRAVSAWALAHGLATLTADGALSTALEATSNFNHLRTVFETFFSQPLAGS